jgi:hypothetical protein
MWSAAENLRFTIMLGLRKGLALIRGARRTFSEDEQQKIAAAIVDDLERSNWRFEQGPALEGHGQRIVPPRAPEQK